MEPVTHDGQGWSNADQDRVELVDYDPRWPALFRAEARRIRAALSGILAFTLEHFGSTAIPGLAAKPIIDIMLIATDQTNWTRLIEPIQGLGAILVDKILRDAKPADLPVEQPWRFALGINLRTAKTLGLTILQSLLTRADYVVE